MKNSVYFEVSKSKRVPAVQKALIKRRKEIQNKFLIVFESNRLTKVKIDFLSTKERTNFETVEN